MAEVSFSINTTIYNWVWLSYIFLGKQEVKLTILTSNASWWLFLARSGIVLAYLSFPCVGKLPNSYKPNAFFPTETEELRNLANEVSTLLKNTVGVADYSSAYAAVHQAANQRKTERKRKLAQQVSYLCYIAGTFHNFLHLFMTSVIITEVISSIAGYDQY